MTVTFCGHGDYSYGDDIRNRLRETVEGLIKQGADTFLLGGYGSFDMMAAHIVYDLKQKYPYIRAILVIPYLNREYNTKYYDDTEYPPIENVPMRYAIIKRNEWMVDRADVVIAYVNHDWGGAYKTLEYANKKRKTIINLYMK
ncbi:MAG: SLOG family protein [Candidatus Ornithomonoglobus sp.]